MAKGSFNLARVGKYLALLLAICWCAVPAPASGATHDGMAMHLLRAGIAAVADLDGDHVPDVASGVNTGHTPEGYAYRVDVELSGNAERKSFSVFSEEPNGLNIEAIDIDGDHDLDLVITSRMSLRPIGVWINDGRGRFTQGDLQQYSVAAWQTRHSIQSSTTIPNIVLQFERRRPQIAIKAGRIEFRTLNFRLSGVQVTSVAALRIPIESAPFRAPPISHT